MPNLVRASRSAMTLTDDRPRDLAIQRSAYRDRPEVIALLGM
jgi:hypothetical protein